MSYDQDVPECLLGTLFATEGVRDSVTIFNSPTGCKYYPSSNSESSFSREGTFDPYIYMNEFFFSQPRIPCTYLDDDDLIMGYDDKLKRLFDIVRKTKPSIIGIVNSPGASLIGSDLDAVNDTNIPVIRSESPGYSESFQKGFQKTIISMLKDIVPHKKTTRRKTVNLIGISIRELGWKDSLEDLEKLLALCNIEVIASVGAGWSVDEMRDSVNAEANVMLYGHLGNDVAKWYENDFGIPTVFSDSGLPLGFDQLECWIVAVCHQLDCDPSPALDFIEDNRRSAALEIRRMNLHSGLPGGCTFSISSCSTLAYSVIVTLHSYLGMIPVAVETTDTYSDDRIDAYLSENGLTVTNDAFNTPSDVFLGNGNTLASLKFRGLVDDGVDIETPDSKFVRITKEPTIGLGGTMRLLDRTLNALR